jgi:hypothetical protein
MAQFAVDLTEFKCKSLKVVACIHGSGKSPKDEGFNLRRGFRLRPCEARQYRNDSAHI